MSVLMIAVFYILMTAGIGHTQFVPGTRIQTENRALSVTNTVQSAVVVIDVGHGGADSGKVSVTGTMEKTLNLEIALQLKAQLEANGYAVVMTRTDDHGLYQETDSNKKIADMKKRCEIIEQSSAGIVVSIHLNSFTDSKVCGAQAFYYKHSVEGKKLAQCIQSSFKENLNSSNNRVEKANDSYYMLLHTSVPTVIAECGFLSNYEEAKLLEQAEYQQKVANSLYLGIEAYMKEYRKL